MKYRLLRLQVLQSFVVREQYINRKVDIIAAVVVMIVIVMFIFYINSKFGSYK